MRIDEQRTLATDTPIVDKKQQLLEERLKQFQSNVSVLEAHPASTENVSLSHRPAELTEKAPLSFAQQRIWFMQHLEPESAFYNEPVALSIRGQLNIHALTQALDEIVRRHEVMRSTFPLIDGQIVQRLQPMSQDALTIPIRDISTVPVEEQDAEVRRITAEEMAHLFHLDTDIPWRTLLIRLNTEEHVSLTVMHHIITDGWSMEIFIAEIGQLYAAYSGGQAPLLPDLPLQYADYACWQRGWIENEVMAAQLPYWKQRMAEPLPELHLPTDHLRPAIQSYHGRRRALTIPKHLVQRLQEISQQEGTTLFMTLLTAFNVLLYRYSGQEDIIVGSPIAGRRRPELESLIGCFVNTLALRTDLSNNPSFLELLQRVRHVTVDAYDHQDLPFEKLVEELHLERNQSQNPLFQVLFVLQNMPTAVQKLGDLTIEPYDVEIKTAKFDLTLALQEVDQQLEGYIEYNTDLFEEATINGIQTNFNHILSLLVANPMAHIADFECLPDEQWQQIERWNATEKDYTLETLQRMFEAQVARTPEAEAVRYDQVKLSYQELNERANQFAHYLQGLGIGSDTLVAISMDRSLELVIALLSILKTGAAYVPIDPAYPNERISVMLEDADIAVLLTQEKFLKKFPDVQAQILTEKTVMQELANQSKENPVSSATIDNLAYVIYTSGSTGRPKGVMNTQRGISNRLQWMQEAYQLGANDRVLQKTPISFDVSVWEFFWPLLYGAQLVLAKPGGQRDSEYLVATIREQQITTMHFVPSMLRAFLAAPEVESCSSLQRVICSGEALPYDLQQTFFERLPQAKLYNLYGPTEAAIDVTAWECQRDSQEPIVPIGYPIANTQLYILDAYQHLVPIGVVGELYIGGTGLASGYLNQPELTREYFIAHPFSMLPDEYLYRTGDLAYYRNDGAIVYQGRNDEQVKLRGVRIELGEIEHVLNNHPALHESVVLVREDTPFDQRLVAYLRAQPGEEPAASELRSYVRQVLPEAMVPTAFVYLDAFPLQPNGKLDRRALPAPDASILLDEEPEEDYQAPATPTEKQVAEIWAQMLGVSQVSTTANFFEIGGHSLLVAQVLGRIHDVFDVDLPLRMMFQSPTVEALSKDIERVKARTAELKRRPSVRAVSRESYRTRRTED
ncbi:hypothetical protein KDA_67780 [Dictyobacter alpinus]|uniref:Carrier domain-containing protein n=1 Tax=Dictyobacter alpinus TaxID=2014873 RepID=A0A402BIS3_9CHLR|nr:non-ribosomal peptide synthetase [Dictyobacter alpinus]GCE31294.1 hypothetical protein KDA_67780 [Dictyobacter alpinus]